ncbi:hypothetical protein [Rhizobium sp. RU36D]|uniref:hypothetical protein n=1 Tax=Rhizobium sp. RU36D TaxID=1907415 RepID=UPI0009D7AE87|nr:hypothetical protein [Rhizobium sp. RU36D]SMC43349.1 hypothetical protein SAMN05880593_101304 [Rhizobium sp. RU36D]
MNGSTRNSAIAAALILVGATVALLILPKVVLWIGDYSPALAAVAGGAIILSFFAVFWLRARYQRQHRKVE